MDDTERYDAPPLMCIMEEQRGGMGVDERTSISVISICPSTGDVVYDEFEGKRFEIINGSTETQRHLRYTHAH